MNLLLPIALWRGDIPAPQASYTQTNIFFSKAQLCDIVELVDSEFTESTSDSVCPTPDRKNLIIFIGGLMDSYHRVVFREFASFKQDSYPKLAYIPFAGKIYTTFDHKNLFTSWLPHLIASGYCPYIFAHSWGAANICKLLSCLNLAPNSIPLLVTMDPVGYWHLEHKPPSIAQWVNLYIADKWHYITPPNICTYIGHAWNHCKAADIEIPLKNYHSQYRSDKNTKIIAHASIRTMIQTFNTSEEITLY